jgi:hypothetical protein
MPKNARFGMRFPLQTSTSIGQNPRPKGGARRFLSKISSLRFWHQSIRLIKLHRLQAKIMISKQDLAKTPRSKRKKSNQRASQTPSPLGHGDTTVTTGKLRPRAGGRFGWGKTRTTGGTKRSETAIFEGP